VKLTRDQLLTLRRARNVLMGAPLDEDWAARTLREADSLLFPEQPLRDHDWYVRRVREARNEPEPEPVCRCWNEGEWGRVHREDCPIHGDAGR
jgi:hypothetical protein